MAAVWAAAVTGACAVIAQIIISASNNKHHKAEQMVRDAEVRLKLKNIEEKLDIHNGYAEKLGGIAVEIAEIKTELKHLEERK